MMLELCMGAQLNVNREYRRGLSMQPCGALVLRISEEEVYLLTHTSFVPVHQEVEYPAKDGSFQTQISKLQE